MKNRQDLDRLAAAKRREYRFGKIADGSLSKNPHSQFKAWFYDAARRNVTNLVAMTLATAGRNAKPSARLVLLKAFSAKGLVFYSHYESLKGRNAAENPQAEAVFFWPEVERQVRVFGKLKKLKRSESAVYFAGRSRPAQIGAWISQQSRSVKNRAALELKYRAMEKKFEGKKIPLPPFWGGFILVPKSYEFWQGRESRLNDRIIYTRSGSRWKQQRLQP